MSQGIYKILLLFFLMDCALSSSRIPCPPDFCNSFQCPQPSCAPNEHVKKKGDICGCCDTCAIYLNEGDLCSVPFLGTPASFECSPGLVCCPDSRKCVKVQCESKNKNSS